MDLPAYEEFFKQMKINLWLLGTPYGDTKVHSRFYILVFIIMIMAISEAAYFVSSISSENLLELTQLAPCTAVGVLSILKVITVGQNHEKIFKLSESLRQLYNPILANPKMRQLVRHDLVLVKLLMKYFIALNLVLISVYNFSTSVLMFYRYLATREVVFMLPYAVLVPFSTDSWVPWLAVYSYSIICGFICVLFYTTVDGLYFVLTSHVCANFCVISHTIRSLDETSVDSLGDIVKSHQYILKLGEDLEDIFTAPNLFNVLVGSLEICALGFNITGAIVNLVTSFIAHNQQNIKTLLMALLILITTKTGSWEQMPGNLLFLTSVLLQILMMSVFGENIIRGSTKIGEAAFLCNWYKMDQKSKKIILTIMIRSHKSQKLTAYKFSTICYASFTKIISTSWSYFTILKTVYKPPELKTNV